MLKLILSTPGGQWWTKYLYLVEAKYTFNTFKFNKIMLNEL